MTEEEVYEEGEYDEGTAYQRSGAKSGTEGEIEAEGTAEGEGEGFGEAEGEEEGVVEEEIPRLGDSSEDEEKKRQYKEYIQLVKEINGQNRTVEIIKGQIIDMANKPCKTRCEMKEIKRMQACMEEENLKLQTLMTRAVQLQNFGSKRRYYDLKIATTFDEDNMQPYVHSCQPQESNWKENKTTESSDGDKSSETASDSQDDRTLKQLCYVLGKMKICCPDDKKLVQEIATALLSKRQSSRPPCPAPPQADSRPSPKCTAPNRPAQCRARKAPKPKAQPASARCNETSRANNKNPCDDVMEKLKCKIASMQESVNRLQCEIEKREKKRNDCNEDEEQPPYQEDVDVMTECLKKRNTKQDQLLKLKENYVYLLSEFAKKDLQLKELEKRVKSVCGSCGAGVGAAAGGPAGDAEQSELALLRTRVNEMKEEQVEFKCIMKEQAQQLEDYRNKYLTAQQKVEEQSVTLDKLNMSNKRIEKQINTEVKEIRSKFQEKLNELLQFPKLLENEQLKLAQTSKVKEDLQAKLVLVCKELRTLKAKQDERKDENLGPQLARCQMELASSRERIDELLNQVELYCVELNNKKDELDTLRCESAKIIARAKERAEQNKQNMQEQINRLEKELAQCRATACLSVSDREAVIREMQGQLNTLSYSFDAAQKQIKTLRNHIAYVSNENCFAVKC